MSTLLSFRSTEVTGLHYYESYMSPYHFTNVHGQFYKQISILLVHILIKLNPPAPTLINYSSNGETYMAKLMISEFQLPLIRN